jgi:hypothetical protein
MVKGVGAKAGDNRRENCEPPNQQSVVSHMVTPQGTRGTGISPADRSPTMPAEPVIACIPVEVFRNINGDLGPFGYVEGNCADCGRSIAVETRRREHYPRSPLKCPAWNEGLNGEA